MIYYLYCLPPSRVHGVTYKTLGVLLRIHFRLLASDKNRNDENGAGDDAGEQDKNDTCGENGWGVES